jgi:hypothetical protein
MIRWHRFKLPNVQTLDNLMHQSIFLDGGWNRKRRRHQSGDQHIPNPLTNQEPFARATPFHC